MKQREKLI